MTACSSRRTKRGNRVGARGGFTLAEALLASVVLAVAVLGISQLTGASSQQSEALRQDSRAVALARELMEEIASKPFTDPSIANANEEYQLGPDTGETSSRSTWDNVDDYHNFTDQVSNTGSTLKTASGATVVDPSKYATETFTRSVKVEYRTSPSGSAVTAGPTQPADFALVTVTVTTARGRPLVLTQMFTKTTLVN